MCIEGDLLVFQSLLQVNLNCFNNRSIKHTWCYILNRYARGIIDDGFSPFLSCFAYVPTLFTNLLKLKIKSWNSVPYHFVSQSFRLILTFTPFALTLKMRIHVQGFLHDFQDIGNSIRKRKCFSFLFYALDIFYFCQQTCTYTQ